MMKTILAFFITATVLLSGSATGQDYTKKGSYLCSQKKMSVTYPSSLGDSPNTPKHSFDVLNYKLNLDIRSCFLSPYSRAFQASNEITFRVDTALSSIPLNAVNTSLVIDSVRLAAVSFSHASNILTINLNRTYAVGETVTVRIYYRHNNVTDAGFYASGGMVFTDAEPEGARCWYPCWDKPWDKATLDLRAKTPASVKLGSNGRLADSTTVGDTTWFHWVSRDPISTYLVVMSAKVNYGLNIVYWHKLSNPNDSIPFRFYYNIGENPATMMQRIIPMTDRYSTLFGEHAFEKNGFASLNSQFAWGGMENQTLTSLCQNCWNENLISHEFAHQWFGDMITCGTWADVWMNEGFATYCEALWYEYTGGPTSYKNDILSDASYYLSSNPGWPIYNPSWAITTPPTGTLFNTAITYDKGACVLHMLRYTLGDSLFFAVLRSYATDTVNFKFGNVVTADFVTKVSEVAGQDMSWFFTWVYQPNHPVYDNVYNITSLGSGQWQVAFKAHQSQTNTPFFPMPLTLRISFTSGSDTIFRVMNTVDNQVFAFRFGRQAATLTFDPNNDIVLKQGGTGIGPTLSTPTLVGVDTASHPLSPVFIWNQAISAATYRLQVATDAGFTSLAFNDSTITDTARQVNLAPSTQYYWHVSAKNSGGTTPFSTPLQFTTPTTAVHRAYSLAGGWNLISLVLNVADPRTALLFPTATSPAFAFSPGTGYQTRDSLQNGLGYWLKFPSSQDVDVSGHIISADTIAVEAGWNLIGSISATVDTTALTTLPPDNLASRIYGYSNGYFVTDSLYAGKGYWAKFTQAGLTILSSGAGLNTRAMIRVSRNGEQNAEPGDKDVPPASAKRGVRPSVSK